MAIDSSISILQGTDIEPGLGFQTAGAVEQVQRLIPIDWDQVPGANVQTYASFSPTITGLNNIRYRLRDGITNPTSVGTLGVNLRGEVTEVPGGPYTTLITSASFAKPTGIDCVQLTSEGIGGQTNNSAGTVEVGIIPDVGGPLVFFSSLRGGYTNQPAPEALVTQYLFDYDRFTSTNVRVTMACHYRNTNFGLASLFVRQGGTYNVPDGTLLASNVAIPINFLGYLSLTAVYARPAGTEMLKISQAGPFIQDVVAPSIWVQEA